MGKYNVTVKTGEESGAGTNTAVTIGLIGISGKEKQCPLDTDDYNDFQWGDEKTYSVETDLDEPLQKITMYCNDKYGSWLVDWVGVHDFTSNLNYYAKFNCWLNGWSSETSYRETRELSLGDPKEAQAHFNEPASSQTYRNAMSEWFERSRQVLTDLFESAKNVNEVNDNLVTQKLAELLSENGTPGDNGSSKKRSIQIPTLYTTGHSLSAGVGFWGSGELGDVYSSGRQVGTYVSASPGLELGAGITGARIWGVWLPKNPVDISEWAFAVTSGISFGKLGVNISCLWNYSFESGKGVGAFLGVEACLHAGVGASVPAIPAITFPYTWVWA